MDSSSDSEVLSERKRRLSRKRVWEDEDMGSNDSKKEKTGNLSKLVLCNGAKRNSTSCVCALARAKDVHENLSPQFPSCVKLVTQLQVPGGKEQYLNLTKSFCCKHLPIDNVTVTFVDENEKEFRVGYRFTNCRFRIGWRDFAIANRLAKGDALVFHLTEHCKFKVYIVRSCLMTKVDGAIQNPSVDVPIETDNVKENRDQMAEDGKNVKAIKDEVLDYSSEDCYQDKYLDYSSENSHQEYIPQGSKSDRTPAADRFNNLCSDAIGMRFSASAVKFQEVKRFEDFKIYVDGLILDSELPIHAKVKYYELCCAKKMFLHDRLISGLCSKLVIGMISEMSNIADAIKSTSLAASLHNLKSWDKTLKAFEDLGMSVGFLRTRIDKLVKLSREYEIINQSKDARFVQVEAKKRTLMDKLSAMDVLQRSIATLKVSIKSLEAEIGGVEGKNEELGIEFTEIAAASW